MQLQFISSLSLFLFISHSYVGKLLFTAGLNLNDLLLLQFLLLNSTRLDLYDLIKIRREIKMRFLIFMTLLTTLMAIKSANSMAVRNKKFNKLCVLTGCVDFSILIADQSFND